MFLWKTTESYSPYFRFQFRLAPPSCSPCCAESHIFGSVSGAFWVMVQGFLDIDLGLWGYWFGAFWISMWVCFGCWCGAFGILVWTFLILIWFFGGNGLVFLGYWSGAFGILVWSFLDIDLGVFRILMRGWFNPKPHDTPQFLTHPPHENPKSESLRACLI